MAKILVIDDSKDLLEMLEFILRIHLHIVETAACKTEALFKTMSFKPDIILVDVRLHFDDGRELCKEIKSKSEKAPIILLLSASPELLKEYSDCYADDVIEKPFTIETIASKIDRYYLAV